MNIFGRSSNEPINPQLERHMKELGEAIGESLADSKQIAEVVAKIKGSGYDVVVILQVNVGFIKDATSLTSSKTLELCRQGMQQPKRLQLTQQDEQFLKSLGISGE